MKKLIKTAAILTAIFILTVTVSYFTLPFTPSDYILPASLILTDRDDRILRVFLNRDEQILIPVDIKDINSNVFKAVIAAEDKRFFKHRGVDPAAAARALFDLIKKGRIVSGASTISMQTARLMAPADRNIISKFIEVIRSVDMEKDLSKIEILNQYLNRLPFGSNIVGIKTAALIYFNKNPENLSVNEAAILAGIPKNPNRYNPLKHPKLCNQRRLYVLRRMYEEKMITTKEYGLYCKETNNLPGQRNPLPFRAPHFSEYVYANVKARSGYFKTTLSERDQKVIENIMTWNIDRLKQYNIHNSCAVILENRTGNILAYAGSQDYFDNIYSGQVQGPLAVRSPGSALKPFLYLRAIAKEGYTPERYMPDIPTYYVDSRPENADHTFRGITTFRAALQNSLNVPAIRLLNRTGLAQFKDYLGRFGITTLKKPGRYYGLGLVIGSGDVTLLELTNAYRVIAASGLFTRCGFSNEKKEGCRLCSPEAAFIITDILSNKQFGDLNMSPEFAFKTGTSSNHRDAWCLGYNTEITAGVWTGNFDGETSKYISGRTASYPALKRIFNSLFNGKKDWFRQPRYVQKRKVCSVSGMVPSEFCGKTIDSYYILGISDNKPCNIHKKVYVTKNGKYKVCTNCMVPGDYKERVIEEWPPDISVWLSRWGMQRDRIPPHNPNCIYRNNIKKLKIVSPLNNSRYHILENHHRQKIKFETNSDAGVNKIFYFVDGEFFGETRPEEYLLYPLKPGKHNLVCINEYGANDRIKFEVILNR